MSTVAADFAQQVAALRPDLMRFARMQLRNEAWAEDAVSETLLAALAKPEGFGQRSQLKTWLVGILKFKLIDQLRANRKTVSLDEMSDSAEADEGRGEAQSLLDALQFAADGHYAQPLREWGDPQAHLTNQQFMQVLEACVNKLPNNLGRVFLMREWLELDADEVCKTLNISATNLYVQLHRSRLRLRECLELNWFGRAPAD